MKLKFAFLVCFIFLISCEKSLEDFRDEFLGTFKGKYQGSFTLSIPDSEPNAVSGIDCEIVVTKGNQGNLIALNYNIFYQDRTTSNIDTIEIKENGIFEGWEYKSYLWYNVKFVNDSILVDTYESGASYVSEQSFRCKRIEN